ncbi:MAG: hypothetical protein ABSG15_09765, partial [FCB group bacterium]
MKNFTNKIVVCCLLAFLVVLALVSTTNAQDTKFRDQAWRYGLNLGLNYNSASLGWQYLLDDALYQPRKTVDFNKPSGSTKDNGNGKGYGFYGGIFLEYLSESWWGIQIRASYDLRNALVKDTYAKDINGNPITTAFDTRMSYFSFEPAIRIDQHLIP